MPRRNRRDFDPVPLDGIEPAPPPPVVRTWQEIKAEREQRSERLRERTRARRLKRMVDAIDWHGGCLVPGCEDKVFSHAGFVKNPDMMLPLCANHEIVVWRTVQRGLGNPDYIELINTQVADEVIAEERDYETRKREHLAKNDGQIYFLRLNGLIKAGWSRALTQRLKAYGPDVEVLCHYPATRQEETDLHRSLRPYLAKGREWYSECKLIDDMVARIIEKYGPPSKSAYWTEPKPDAVRLRRRTA